MTIQAIGAAPQAPKAAKKPAASDGFAEALTGAQQAEAPSPSPSRAGAQLFEHGAPDGEEQAEAPASGKRLPAAADGPQTLSTKPWEHEAERSPGAARPSPADSPSKKNDEPRQLAAAAFAVHLAALPLQPSRVDGGRPASLPAHPELLRPEGGSAGPARGDGPQSAKSKNRSPASSSAARTDRSTISPAATAQPKTAGPAPTAAAKEAPAAKGSPAAARSAPATLAHSAAHKTGQAAAKDVPAAAAKLPELQLAKPASAPYQAAHPAATGAAPQRAAAPAAAPAAAAARIDELVYDPSLRVDMKPGEARVSLDAGGGISLHVQVENGVANVRASGTAAPLLAQNLPELRAQLAQSGLSLGGFESGDSRREQPEAERAEAPTPGGKPIATTTSQRSSKSRLEVEA
jgi:hypothetical protein